MFLCIYVELLYRMNAITLPLIPLQESCTNLQTIVNVTISLHVNKLDLGVIIITDASSTLKEDDANAPHGQSLHSYIHAYLTAPLTGQTNWL